MISLRELRNPSPRISSRIGATGIVILALVGAYQNLAGAHFSSGGTDAVSMLQGRFEPLKATLSARLGAASNGVANNQIGFVTDLRPGNASDVAHFLAEYSLAPLLVVPGRPYPLYLLDPQLLPVWKVPATPAVHPEWVVGIIDTPGGAPAVAQREGLGIVQDFGGGVVLLRRLSK